MFIGLWLRRRLYQHHHLIATRFGRVQRPSQAPKATEVYIQLLQLTEYNWVHDRTIYYCEMASHVSAVPNGRRVYLNYITAEACKAVSTLDILVITPVLQVSGLRTNVTEYCSMTLSGSITLEKKQKNLIQRETSLQFLLPGESRNTLSWKGSWRNAKASRWIHEGFKQPK